MVVFSVFDGVKELCTSSPPGSHIIPCNGGGAGGRRFYSNGFRLPLWNQATTINQPLRPLQFLRPFTARPIEKKRKIRGCRRIRRNVMRSFFSPGTNETVPIDSVSFFFLSLLNKGTLHYRYLSSVFSFYVEHFQFFFHFCGNLFQFRSTLVQSFSQ